MISSTRANCGEVVSIVNDEGRSLQIGHTVFIEPPACRLFSAGSLPINLTGQRLCYARDKAFWSSNCLMTHALIAEQRAPQDGARNWLPYTGPGLDSFAQWLNNAICGRSWSTKSGTSILPPPAILKTITIAGISAKSIFRREIRVPATARDWIESAISLVRRAISRS